MRKKHILKHHSRIFRSDKNCIFQATEEVAEVVEKTEDLEVKEASAEVAAAETKASEHLYLVVIYSNKADYTWWHGTSLAI